MKAFEKSFLGMYQDIGVNQGVDALTSEIFGILLLEPQELSLEELAKRTGYSLSSVSNRLQLLVGGGLVQQVSKPGTKKRFVYLEKDILKILRVAMMRKQKNVIAVVKERMPDILAKGEREAESEAERKKLQIMREYYESMKKFEKVLRKTMEELENIA